MRPCSTVRIFFTISSAYFKKDQMGEWENRKRNWNGSLQFFFDFSVSIWHCLCYIFKSNDLRHSMPEQLHICYSILSYIAKQEMQFLYEMYRCLKKNIRYLWSTFIITFIFHSGRGGNDAFSFIFLSVLPPPTFCRSTAVSLFCDNRKCLGEPL